MLSIDELADRRYVEPPLSAGGEPLDPLLVVDLTSRADRVEEAVVATGSLSGRSAVVVGVAEGGLDAATFRGGEGIDHLVEAVDLNLAATSSDRRVVAGPVDETLGAIETVVDASPRAAVSLAGLMRITSAVGAEAGLLAESFAYSSLQAGPEFATWRSANPVRELPAPTGEPLRVERHGSTLTLTLTNAARHNAFTAALRDQLVDALTIVDLDPSIDLVELCGEGRSFCSGGDLDEFGTAPDPATAHLVRGARSAGLLLHRLRDRARARVHGACIGAGTELPSFVGWVSAAPDSFFQLPELTMGLVPGAGGTVSVTGRVGRWRTAAMALTAGRVDAVTALEWGLVDEVVDV